MSATIALARDAGKRLLDLLLPPRCLACGEGVDAQGGLCSACWAKLTFLAPPACACCGLPFAFEAAPDALCGACLKAPPAFARARAALAYDDGSRGLILGFKHGDRTDAAPALGRWLARAGAELVADAELIVPVPLHRWRLARRRYNQAALLAIALGHLAARPVVPDLLERRRPTPSQAGRNRRQRAENVAGAIAVRAKRRPLVADRRILVIDDVLTTGATVESCARALKRAGAAAVDVLTLARVVRPAG